MVTVSGPPFWLFLFLWIIIWKEQLTGSRVCLGSQFEGIQSIMARLRGHCIHSQRAGTKEEVGLGYRASSPSSAIRPPARLSLLQVLQPSKQLQQLESAGSDMLACGGHSTSKAHQAERPLSKILKTGTFYILNFCIWRYLGVYNMVSWEWDPSLTMKFIFVP